MAVMPIFNGFFQAQFHKNLSSHSHKAETSQGILYQSTRWL